MLTQMSAAEAASFDMEKAVRIWGEDLIQLCSRSELDIKVTPAMEGMRGIQVCAESQVSTFKVSTIGFRHVKHLLPAHWCNKCGYVDASANFADAHQEVYLSAGYACPHCGSDDTKPEPPDED